MGGEDPHRPHPGGFGARYQFLIFKIYQLSRLSHAIAERRKPRQPSEPPVQHISFYSRIRISVYYHIDHPRTMICPVKNKTQIGINLRFLNPVVSTGARFNLESDKSL